MTGKATLPRSGATLRWLGLLIRSLHLVALVGLGAAMLGAELDLNTQLAAALASGIALMLLELARRPQMIFEWSGLSLMLKLLAVAWLALQPATALPLFWAILVWSVLFAHAPRGFRHRRWL